MEQIFVCLHGDCDNLPLAEKRCFAVTDTQSREWLCYEGTEEDMVNPLAGAFDTMKAQHQLSKQGMAKSGTKMSALRCQREELSKKLGERK